MRAHPLPSWNIRGVQATGSPTTGRGQPKSRYHAGDFEGIDAPWILSALPECLLPQSTYRRKTLREVLAYVPRDAHVVEPGTGLLYRDCRIAVRPDDAIVTRGRDRFHIPPDSHFYTTATKLVFVRVSRWAELRTYTMSNF